MVLAPLQELTGNAPWRWEGIQQEAFQQAKKLLKQYVPLTPINYDEVKSGNTKVFLITDASHVSTGAYICHGNDMDQAHSNIAAIHSRRFNSAQENYNTTNKELLAIVDALQAFETKLLGIKFTVVTDHKALVYLMTKPLATGRLARWIEHMQMFDFEILHIPGQTNRLAAALSRLYESDNVKRVPNDELLDERLKREDFSSDEDFLDSTTTIQSTNTPVNTISDSLLVQPSSPTNAMSSYRTESNARKCRPDLHWLACRSRDGCPWHYTSYVMETLSTFKPHNQYHLEHRGGPDDDDNLSWITDDEDDDEEMEDPSGTDGECPDPETDPIGNYEWLCIHGYYVTDIPKNQQGVIKHWDPNSGEH
jgi:hypothetical protein